MSRKSKCITHHICPFQSATPASFCIACKRLRSQCYLLHTIGLLPLVNLFEQVRQRLPRPPGPGRFRRALGNGGLNVSEESNKLLLAMLSDRVRQRSPVGLWSDDADGRAWWALKTLPRSNREEQPICKFHQVQWRHEIQYWSIQTLQCRYSLHFDVLLICSFVSGVDA